MKDIGKLVAYQHSKRDVNSIRVLKTENKKAVLSQREPRDAALNFDTYRIAQPIVRAVSLPQHGFLVNLCLQTAVNHLPKSDI